MASVTIREVTEKDYDAVIAIRKPEDILHGFDYLPDYFMMIMKTPGYKGFVALVDGKIVAFEFACLIDGGKTMITRASRVSKEYTGKGTIQALSSFVRNYYLKTPSLMYSTGTFNDEMYFKRIHLMVKEGIHHLVHERVIIPYRGSIRAIKNLLTTIDTPEEVKEVTENGLSRIFDSPNTCQKLFPDGRLIVDWVPYRPMKSNIPYIFTERCSIFGSNIGLSSDSSSGLLTFASFIICRSIILCNFDVYGSNTKALSGHLIAHLKTLKNVPHDVLQMEFLCDDNINREHCDFAAKEARLAHYDLFRCKSFCTERVLKDNANLDQEPDVRQSKAKL